MLAHGNLADYPLFLVRLLLSKNGYSDPYIKLAVGGHKFATQVIRKCLDPVWDAAFDFVIEAQSLPDHITLMFWDKDRWGRDDFLGTVNIPFEAASIWADGKPKHFNDAENEVCLDSIVY